MITKGNGERWWNDYEFDVSDPMAPTDRERDPKEPAKGAAQKPTAGAPRVPGVAGWWAEALGSAAMPRYLLGARDLGRLPRGNAETVLVLPGFGAGDLSTFVLRSTLRRYGYNAVGWQLGTNRGDVLGLLPRVIERTGAIAQDGVGEIVPVRLVGWSLGGVLAREVARERPDLVDRVVTLGSPVVGGPKFTNVATFYEALGRDVEALAERVALRNRTPIRVPITVIYSKNDGVVDWRASIDEVSPQAEHFEVSSSHLLLGVDPEVLRLVVRRLAD